VIAALVVVGPSLAEVGDNVIFGNPIVPREQTDGYKNQSPGSVSDFVVLDLNPLYSIEETGKLTRWQWYSQKWATTVKSQAMDLMVWRPVTTTAAITSTYTLEFTQRVVSKTWGAQWVDAVGDFTVRPGDVLGYYVPTGYDPVLALTCGAGAGTDPVWLGSGVLGVGATHDFTGYYNGSRTYSLAADLTVVPSSELSPVPEAGTIVAALSILAPAGMFFRRRKA
jgi:hypothetical protein